MFYLETPVPDDFGNDSWGKMTILILPHPRDVHGVSTYPHNTTEATNDA
jgi:hypothetical protein